MEGNCDFDVFISYSSQNQQLADAICHILEEHKIRCWIAPRNVQPGVPYAREIINGIKSCKIMVLVFTHDTNVSEHVANELEIAFKHKKIIIPFIAEDVPMNEDFSYYLQRKHWFTAYPHPEKSFHELVKVISSLRIQSDSITDYTIPSEEEKPLESVTSTPNTNAQTLTDDVDFDLDYDDAIVFMQNGELQEAMYSLQASFENGNAKTIPLFNKLLFQNFGKINWDEETWEFLEQQAKANHSFAHLAFFYKYLHNKEEQQQAATYLKAAYKCDRQNGYTLLCQGIAMERGIGERPNLLRAMSRYEQAYKKGISEACSYVAEMYLNGSSGQAIDENKALEILEKGCENNDARSYFILGAYYSKNAHIEESWKKAIKYFQKAADLQEHEAWIKLGKLYHYKRFSEEYNGKELSCYFEALKNGIKDAYAYIAQIRWDEDRQQEAIIQAQKGEKEGSVLSISKLGRFYEKGLQEEGHWIKENKPDFAKAWDYYRKAFKLGERIEDAISMARLYVKDEYRPEDVSWDTIEGYLEKGAREPITEALELLIEALKENGKEKDIRKYLDICAKSGSLEMMHKYGIFAQSSDKSGEALKLIEDAGDKNYHPSVEWLMDYYKNREPSSKDYEKWLEKAVEIGIDIPYNEIHIIIRKNKDKAKEYLLEKYSDDHLEPLYWITENYQLLEIDHQWLLQELRSHYTEIYKDFPLIFDLYADFLLNTGNDIEYDTFSHEIARTDEHAGNYLALYKEIQNIRETMGNVSKELAQRLSVLSQDRSVSYLWRNRAIELCYRYITINKVNNINNKYAHIITPKETKILIVDDVISNTLLLKVLLANEKYNVYTANNGNSCIEIAQKEKPDLILLDTMMPDINGFDVAKILKMNPETENIPIIFLSAIYSDMQCGYQAGAIDFIIKPFIKEELYRKVFRGTIIGKMNKIVPIEMVDIKYSKILIVDDVVSNILLLKILLTSEKFQVCTATNGMTCIEQVKKERPDLILLDVMMPDISGFDVATILKTDPETWDVPIMNVTALHDTNDMIHALQVGADDFITKPFNKEDLIMRINKILYIDSCFKLLSKLT